MTVEHLDEAEKARDEARPFMLEAAEVRQALDAYRIVPEKETSAVRVKALITQRDEAWAEVERLRDALRDVDHDSFTHGDTGAVCSGCDAVKALEASRKRLP